MRDVTRVFTSLISVALGLENKVDGECDNKRLLDLANLHDLTHLISFGARKAGYNLGEYTDEFSARETRAIFRHVKIHKELTDMTNAFERIGVDFIFLKGSTLRYLYPAPWMRTSSDIDVLIRPEHIEKAKDTLIKLGYNYLGEWRYEQRFDSPTNVHIEMHTTLVDDEDATSEYLSNIWDKATIVDGFSHKYDMSDEQFLFYHIAHMAKHMSSGGCGVRPFVDLVIINSKGENKAFHDTIKSAKLHTFYDAVKALIAKWFKGENRVVTAGLEEYVLRGGLFGTYENTVSVRGGKGKIAYVFGRIFPRYRDMSDMYPVLKKCKILLPIFYIVRWFSLVIKFIKGKGRDELKAVKNMDKSDATAVAKLFEELGLGE